MQQQLTQPNLLTLPEAAQALRISRSSLYRLMGRQELGSVRVGGRRLISRRVLEAFIARLEETASGTTRAE